MVSLIPSHSTGRRLLYEALHLYSQTRGFSTFNIGYAPIDSSIAGHRHFSREPHQIQLYAELMNFAERCGAPLHAACSLLEVGAAGGGGVRYLRWRYPGATVLGIDNAVFAVVSGRLKGLDIRRGDAFSLPVPDETYDCVLCVDSFSIFPRVPFLKEVRRVLKPGGALLIGDYLLGTPDQIHRDLAYEATAGDFHISAFQDVTPGVLKAIEADHDRKARIVRWLPGRIKTMMSETMSLHGSERHRNWVSGNTCYYMALLHPNAPVGI